MSKFLKGDVVKLKAEATTRTGIDHATSFTLTSDEDIQGYIEFYDIYKVDRYRPANHFYLVSRPGEKVESVATETAMAVVGAGTEPNVTFSRVGDVASLYIYGNLSRDQVESILNIVFDN